MMQAQQWSRRRGVEDFLMTKSPMSARGLVPRPSPRRLALLGMLVAVVASTQILGQRRSLDTEFRSRSGRAQRLGSAHFHVHRLTSWHGKFQLRGWLWEREHEPDAVDPASRAELSLTIGDMTRGAVDWIESFTAITY